MGFSRQEYWSGLPFPSPGDLPNPGIEPGSPALQADSLLLIHHEALGVIYSFTNFSIMEQTRFQLPKFIFDKKCCDEKQHILVKKNTGLKSGTQGLNPGCILTSCGILKKLLNLLSLSFFYWKSTQTLPHGVVRIRLNNFCIIST